MKKISFMLVLILILMSFCSCKGEIDSADDQNTDISETEHDSVSNTEDDGSTNIENIESTENTQNTDIADNNIQNMLNQIYAVDETLCATDEEKSKKNLIDVRSVSSIDPDAPASLKKEILGKEYNLTYVETLTYPYYGMVSDKYVSESFGENDKILIRRDGSIHALLFSFANISISGKETPQVIKPQLEAVICEIVDVSNYEYCDLPEYNPEKESFGSYYFLYYNMENGYMTDFMSVYVKDDGRIKSLAINDLSIECDLSNVSIDKDLEDKLLSAKTKQVYEKNRYGKCVGYKHIENMHSNTYVHKGEFLVQYNVSPIFLDQKGQQRTSGYIQRILIPIRLLNNSQIQDN